MNNWRISTAKIGETKVYSEGSVEAIIEMVIEDAGGYFRNDFGMREQLRAKWLGKESHD